MKILITDGAGFVESHFCEKYDEDSNTFLCLDNSINGEVTNIRHLLTQQNLKLRNGNTCDSNLLEKNMRDVDTVFHPAAQIDKDRSIIEPEMMYDVNVLGAKAILEIAHFYDVGTTIHVSTSEIHGVRPMLVHNGLLACIFPHYASSVILLTKVPS